MKKIISVLLTVAMLVMSVFCLGASAAETKTGAFIEKFEETKTLSVEFRDEVFSNELIEIKNVKISIKLTENEDGTFGTKVAASAKAGFFNIKAYIDNGEIHAYIPLLRIHINVTELIKEEIDVSDLIGDFDELTTYLDTEYIACMKLKSAGEKWVDGYGNVYVEEFVPDVKAVAKKAVESGAVQLPEGVNIDDLTEEEIIAYISAAGGDAQSIEAMLRAKAESYFLDDKLVGFKAVVVDKDGNEEILEMEPGVIKSITSGVSDKEFEQPKLCFDLTGLIKRIISMIGGI
ncbi:MAG: hypothetical protein ACI4JG_06040 [Acutalibacteraceae bacterium]